MSRTLQFKIPISPVAKQRPRQGKGFTYTPKKTVDFERTVALIAREAFNKSGLTEAFSGPIELLVQVFLKRPEYLDPGKFKRKKISKDAIRHCKKPDLDNLVKSVMDGINKSGVWGDDKLVYHLDAQKYYVEHGSLPGVEVMIVERAFNA